MSPQPQPGRVPDALVVLSLGAPARPLTVTSSVVVVSVVVVSRSRLVIDSFVVAIPVADFSRATADACSGNDTVEPEGPRESPLTDA